MGSRQPRAAVRRSTRLSTEEPFAKLSAPIAVEPEHDHAVVLHGDGIAVIPCGHVPMDERQIAVEGPDLRVISTS